MGGEKEDELNRRIAGVTGIKYPGYFYIKEFFKACADIEVFVTADTFGLHAAIGLGKKVIALFGPTSGEEVDLYGRGEKLTAPLECVKCYKKSCGTKPNCMELILPDEVLSALRELI